jgi:NAD(P)-dependent dehydrogenase (short-subunit alcohol dehydrogenase family)
VALVARRADRLATVAREAQDLGGQAQAISADVTQKADVERIIARTVAGFGGIDVLVNAAGTLVRGSVESTSMQEWDRLMDVNVRAIVQLTQYALPHLIERGGSIVNVSSVAGFRSYPGMLAYCVSKAAVDQLTRCIALDVASKGVRVNAVQPSVIVTNFHLEGGMSEEEYATFLERSKDTHPLGRVGKPEEVADLIFFLASPQAGWITGACYPIDGGRGQTCPL